MGPIDATLLLCNTSSTDNWWTRGNNTDFVHLHDYAGVNQLSIDAKFELNECSMAQGNFLNYYISMYLVIEYIRPSQYPPSNASRPRNTAAHFQVPLWFFLVK